MSRTRGIPEVPLGLDPEHRRFLTDLRQIVIQLQGAQAPPTVPSNLRVTAEPFGNLVQWTRSVNADFFEVLWNTTPSLNGAVAVNVGSSAQWTDNIGQSGVKRFYWVRGVKNSGARSLETGPLSGTSLASNAGVNPPTPPPPGQAQVTDQRTGSTQYWKVGNST